VVSILIDEFERLTIAERQMKASENALAAAKGHRKSQACGSTSNTTKTDVEGCKCRKKGHMKADCCSKARKKEKEENKKGSRSANTAMEGKEFAFTTTFAVALGLGTSSLMGRKVNVYDLSTSGHMLPNRHHFTTFKEIVLHAINVMDKTVFKATGMGNMRIGILNGKTTKHVTLKDVLYCPDLALTLISLTCCDAAGYSVLLKDQKCLIRDSRGMLLGQVPLSNGLYKVEHKDTAAVVNAAPKVLMLDELHRRMGHISPQVAWKPVRDGTITGLEIDMVSQPGFCTVCAQAKPTCQPIPQKWEGPRAEKFGEKVHLDVWRPKNPQSCDGKEYFVSFTNDHNRWMYLVPMS
jgi:Pol polyprotein, beta-barrel domain